MCAMAAEDSSNNNNYKPGDLCLECQQLGVRNTLRYFYINLEMKIIKCESNVCMFPHSDTDSDLDELEFTQSTDANDADVEMRRTCKNEEDMLLNDDNWLEDILNENDNDKDNHNRNNNEKEILTNCSNFDNLDLSFLQDDYNSLPKLPVDMPVLFEASTQENSDNINQDSQTMSIKIGTTICSKDLEIIPMMLTVPDDGNMPQLKPTEKCADKEEETTSDAEEREKCANPMAKTEIASYFDILKKQSPKTVKISNNTKNFKKRIKNKMDEEKSKKRSDAAIGDTSLKAVLQLLKRKKHT